MKKFTFVLLIVLSFLLLTGQGCIGVRKKEPVVGPPDAAVWVSRDRAGTWQQFALMPTIQGVKNLGDLSLNLLVFDPQDPEIIYWGAGDFGLLVSYDAGRSWQETKGLLRARVNDLVVDPSARNIVYASIGNRIFKTTDCCYSWQDIYIDASGSIINALALDPANPFRILAGLADGRLIRSEDAGLNWSVFHDFKTSIKQILYNPREPRIIYVGTNSEGIFRSGDAGSSWEKNQALEKISGAKRFHYGFFDETQRDALYVLTDAGFLRSNEEINEWQEYKLLTPPGRVRITAFTANPINPNQVYYATESTFYKSENGGQTWITQEMPTTSRPVYLTTYPANPNILYMGAAKK